MSDLEEQKSIIGVLLLLFAIAWFCTLSARTLVPTDEGRYAEMAREMAATGDWITPRLNGIKYFEKPPLQTWMNALTFQAFGLGEWQARLWTGLCGFFGIALSAYAGWRVFNACTGFAAGAVLASSFLWVALGHLNTLDMGLTGMMTLALCALLIAQRNDATVNERRNWMLTCWTGMALAVLSKGLIGVVLPGAVLVLYSLMAHDWAIWKRLHIGLGLLAFFAITTPWFVLVSLKNPEFPHFFFVHEHFQRFTSKIHHREGPWYYFIPILILGIMPWTGILAQSLQNGWRDPPPGFQPKKLLLAWAAFIFFFFSISGSKLASYILPILPALALLIACHIKQGPRKAVTTAAGLLALISAVGLVFVSKIPTMTNEAYEIPLYQAYMPWAVGASGLGLLGSLLSIRLARHRIQWAIMTLAATGFLSGQALLMGHEPFGRYASGLSHVPAIQAELIPEMPIYSIGRYEHALPFYLQRTLILVEHPDEMAFGLDQEPQLWLSKRETFIAKWNTDHAAGRKNLAIMRPDIYTDLQKQGLPMRIIAQDPRRIIVTNDLKK